MTGAGEISPGPDVETDEEILAWVAKDSETALRTSCSLPMGTDEMSVTDIYAPVIMLAEKAADRVRV